MSGKRKEREAMELGESKLPPFNVPEEMKFDMNHFSIPEHCTRPEHCMPQMLRSWLTTAIGGGRR